MRAFSRRLWFIAGGLTFAGCVFIYTIYHEFNNPKITIHVNNSLDHPAHIRIAGASRTLDLGNIAPNAEVKEQTTIDEVGEGGASFVVDAAGVRTQYSLGYFISGKGPFERFVNLTPAGPVAFFYSPSKGGWCGLLSIDPAQAAPAMSQPSAERTR